MKYMNIILLSSTWNQSHRKGLYSHLNTNLSKWSDAVFVESAFSILIHSIFRVRDTFKKNKETGNKIADLRTYRPFIIFHHKIWSVFKVTLKIDSKLLSMQIKKFVKKETPDKLIIWAANPFDFLVIEKINPDFIIYDFYDNFSFDEDGTLNLQKDSFNKSLIKKSDLIFCTAIKLYDFAKSLNLNAYYQPNGHNFFFARTSDKVDLNLNGKIIGYIGNIRPWIDFKLIKKLLRKLNDDQYLVFIGPFERGMSKEIENLKSFKQFRYFGPVKYHEIFSYIQNFNIGIIPFRKNRFMEGVFPNKFFEYIAGGIKIVSTNLPDIQKYDKVINVAENDDRFVEMCLTEEKKLNFDIRMYENIKAESSWDIRANFIDSKVKKMISSDDS